MRDSNDPVTARTSKNVGGCKLQLIDYPPNFRQGVHRHDHGSLTLIYRGMVREKVEASEEQGRVLSVVTKPAGVAHENFYGPSGARALAVVFDAEPADERAPLDGWRWLRGGPLARALLCLLKALRRRSTCPANELENLLVDVIAAAGVIPPEQLIRPQAVPDWLRLGKEEIDDGIRNGIKTSDVARSAGVHPVHFARVFRRAYGSSVQEYITSKKVELAAGLLADSDCTIAAAAYKAGFSDQSHLGRRLKRSMGVTPLGLRTLARA